MRTITSGDGSRGTVGAPGSVINAWNGNASLNGGNKDYTQMLQPVLKSKRAQKSRESSIDVTNGGSVSEAN